uniref:RRM domain-containing protein n=1 Tax=Canis lupus familiaris TaxID=9615 RepID=A0A8C0RJY4_CANLF
VALPQPCSLFPPLTEAWLQVEKTPLAPGGGDRKEKKPWKAEEDLEDASFPLSLLEGKDLAEQQVPEQELEAIRLKLWAMEQAHRLETPGAQGQAGEEEGAEGAGATLARLLLSPEAGRSRPHPAGVRGPGLHRSPPTSGPYLWQVDYGSTAEELEAYFNPCGEVHRVTILCDKFSGHPQGVSASQFAAKSSAQAAVELDQSIFRGRVIKVCAAQRTNLPGISSTYRGGLRGQPHARGQPLPLSSLQGGVPLQTTGAEPVGGASGGRGREGALGAEQASTQVRWPRVQTPGLGLTFPSPPQPCRGRGRFSPWYSPY